MTRQSKSGLVVGLTRLIAFGLSTAAIAGAVGAIVLAWLPLSTVFGHFVIEDMGYYLTAANNYAGGRGVTLDGANATNGFHPLWFVVLVTLRMVPGPIGDATMVHVALTICGLCFIATAWLIGREIGRQAPDLLIPFAALFLCNYRLVSLPMGGLETALSGLTVTTVAVAASRWLNRWTVGRSVALGALLGLAYLARLDALLLGLIVLSWLLYHARRAEQRGQMRLVLLSGVVSAAFLLPWFIYSWRTVHGLLPRSGNAILQWSPSPWNPPWTLESLNHAFRQTVVNPSGHIANVFGVWPFINGPGLSRRSGALVLAAALSVLMYAAWRQRRDDGVRRLAWIPLYALCHATYYLQFSANPRYLYPVIVLLFYFSFVVIGAVIRQHGETRTAPTLWLAAALLFASTSIAGYQAYHRGFGAEYTQGMVGTIYDEIVPWVSQQVPSSNRVGSFNGGVLSYLSGRTVVNLDGVMNDNAMKAIASDQLCSYIDTQGIDYIVDNDEAIDLFMDRDDSCVRTDWRVHWAAIHQFRWRSVEGEQHVRWIVLRRVATPTLEKD